MLEVLRQYARVDQSVYERDGRVRLLVAQRYRDSADSESAFRVLRLGSDGNFSWADTSMFAEYAGADGIMINAEDAQRIVDQLWVYGHRPSEAVGSAGALTACNDHLADMRRVVTHFLDDNPLAKPLAAANAMNDRISQFAVSQSLGDTARAVEDQHNDLFNAVREINSFVRERANAEAAHWRDLGGRLECIEEAVCSDDSEITIADRFAMLNRAVSSELNSIIERIGTPDPSGLPDDAAQWAKRAFEAVCGVNEFVREQLDPARDLLTLNEAFDDSESVVWQALVAKGWTPPQ